MTDSSEDRRTAWEERYNSSERIWSGAANAALVDVAGALEPGRALDLGCGEGADAIWLTGRGWRVTGVDISQTALDRARVDATTAGIEPRHIDWVCADLTTWQPEGSFDLASACFLHDTHGFERAPVIARAAASIVPGGHLLIVSHAEMPPWANAHHHGQMPTAEEEARMVETAGGVWEAAIVEVRRRQATGPGGQRAELADNVVLMRRAAR
ncbi:Methyltransferase domain-containing protein [Paramicrobacterium humi]|uniref:Methyltransferase domain-containing protein n=1 Tax=Paramicrobacterium humi TaxID=640635 RepID=A0A1H4NNM8_9MICO|nr:class I SAM-dependent methyltransferase [Microbacterium humi]SEB96714.1 Methyltransferase domain-containing protein [Microbacterium humi]